MIGSRGVHQQVDLNPVGTGNQQTSSFAFTNHHQSNQATNKFLNYWFSQVELNLFLNTPNWKRFRC